MKAIRNINNRAGTVILVTLLLALSSTKTCVKFEPVGFLFVSTDTIGLELGEKGIYEFKGSIVSIGEEPIEQHGFCWSESSPPLLSDDSISMGQVDSKGEFVSDIGGLTALNTYYVRAYAITNEGIVYGNELQFQTTALAVPTVRTEPVTHFKRNSAKCGGEVIMEGLSPVSEFGVCLSTTRNPDLADRVVSGGSGPGSFNVLVEGLELNTVYYVRAYASNGEGDAYGEEVSFKTWAENEVSDYDGNVYPTVKIGEQTWLRRNLRVTHYADGTPIPHVKENWNSLMDGDKAYCWYNNEMKYSIGYGALYTWDAVMNGAESSDANPSEVQGVCPDGWHVPSDQEWQEMEIYLGVDPAEADTIVFRNRGEDYGGSLKETGYTHWRNPNTGATNISGFTAVGGGYRNSYGHFRSLERSGAYWTSTLYQDTDRALTRRLDYNNTFIDRDYNNGYNAASVRCIKDEE
jgi:uncharacterized protein (TIGR02145 family)